MVAPRSQEALCVGRQVRLREALLREPTTQVGHQMQVVNNGAWYVALASELGRKPGREWLKRTGDAEP